MSRPAQFTLVTLALTLMAASCAVSFEPAPVLPSVWKLSMGQGGGIAAAYSSTSIDSTGTITSSSWSMYPKSNQTRAARLSEKELERLTALLVAAYPRSLEGQTPPAPYYTWFDITLDGGAIRSFHSPHSRKVERLALEITALEKSHRPTK